MLICFNTLLGFLLLAVASCQVCEEDGCFTREILDVWSRFRDDSHFGTEYLWMRMNECLRSESTDNLNLWDVSDALWLGMVQYGIQGGAPDGSDNWGGRGGLWIENDPTPLVDNEEEFPSLPMGSSKVEIQEPCNTVSNLAYIRTMLAICDHGKKHQWTLSPETVTALVQCYTVLPGGSAFFHGSQTALGGEIDVEMNDQLALIVLQGSLQAIPYDPILHDIQPDPLPLSGQQLAFEAGRILVDEPLNNWYASYKGLETPSLFKTFAAFFTVVFNLVFPTTITDFLLGAVGGFLLEPEDLNFITDQYQPVLRQALEENNVVVGFKTRLGLVFKTIGFGLKIFKAFAWQEETIPGGHLTDPKKNFLGALSMPITNLIGNKLTGFDRSSDFGFQATFGVYPGDKICRKTIPHAKWHEQSANALVDFIFLGDEVAKVMGGQGTFLKIDVRSELLQCQMERDCFSGFDWSAVSNEASATFESCTAELEEGQSRGFVGCMFSSLIQVGNKVDYTDTKPESLDQCLAENDCLSFNGLRLDVGRLNKCIFGSWFEWQAPCSEFVKPTSMRLCLLWCNGDTFCAARCLQQHAELSPWIDKSISCVNTFGRSSTDEADLTSCLEELKGPLSSFQASIVNGLSAMASCAVHSCDGARVDFTQGIKRLNQCAETCPVAWGTTEFGTDIEGFVCALNCTLSDKER